MPLTPGCPRCSSPIDDERGVWTCPSHGAVPPLWRASQAGYDEFADHLQRTRPLPSFTSWPLAPGWAVTDFGCVAAADGQARACFVSTSGPSELDGVVELAVVSEEPGVGLGARCAAASRTDPGADVGEGPPQAKVRIEGHPIPLWSVSTSQNDVTFDRSVFVGEALGRWLWLVFRPASAALMLRDEWGLHDLADLGPALIDLPFRDGPPTW